MVYNTGRSQCSKVTREAHGEQLLKVPKACHLLHVPTLGQQDTARRPGPRLGTRANLQGHPRNSKEAEPQRSEEMLGCGGGGWELTLGPCFSGTCEELDPNADQGRVYPDR